MANGDCSFVRKGEVSWERFELIRVAMMGGSYKFGAFIPRFDINLL
jgi:hypothetical protein